jgi:hypothetical protein
MQCSGVEHVARIPCMGQAPDGSTGLAVQPLGVSRHEGIQLAEMNILGLRIDVPHERARCPLRAHERILAAHEIDVAGPQQRVVIRLGDERQCSHAQVSCHGFFARTQLVASEEPGRFVEQRPVGNRTQDRPPAAGERLQQAKHIGMPVGEQRHAHRIWRRRCESGGTPERIACTPIRQEGVAARKQVALAQQTTCARREARKKEVLDQRQARMRRRHQVAILDPRLGTEVLEVDPDRLPRPPCHRHQVACRQFAGEGLDHHGGGLDAGIEGRMPAAHVHTTDCLRIGKRVGLRAELNETRQIVDPQPHRQAVFGRKLAREPPADADVAEIVDDHAEDIPSQPRRRVVARNG